MNQDHFTRTLEQLRRGALAGAQRLDLCGDLQQLPEEVFALADTLEVLNLNGNRLTQLPADLGRLHRLRILFCSDNPFERLPEALGDCGSLEMVGFKACQIADVPAESLPPRLRWLILTDNHIGQLPQALGERPHLQKLMLAGNQLQGLPPSLAAAHRLELLRLSANRFESLPSWLTDLPRLAWLAVSGNPLGWHCASATALPLQDWADIRIGPCLGEGASGRIHRVEVGSAGGPALALKLFKGALTSDGLPVDEMRAHGVAGAHPALCHPVAELAGHPEGARGLLLPLLPANLHNLAGPPSFDTCTRDVYAPGLALAPKAIRRLADSLASALAHLHRRGVLHGDLYAHNVLWNPATHQGVLGDFGAASLLPLDHPALRRGLCALDVRAWGVLVGELLLRAEVPPGGDHGLDSLRALARDCQQPQTSLRPTMDEVCGALSSLKD